MSQITIRKLPAEVERELRIEAARTGTSLNKTVIRLLNKATGIPATTGRKRDLSRVAGQWDGKQAAAFDRSTALFEQVDEEIWR